MSRATSENSKANTAVKQPPLVPPDERFWKRYSPHYEFPLSLVSSVFVHVVIFGGIALIITGALLALLGLNKKNLPVDVIQIAGGGGNPAGIGDNKGTAIPTGPEAIPENDKPVENITQNTPPEQLTKPEVKPAPLLEEQTPSKRRANLDAMVSNSDLSEVGRRAREKIQALTAPKGRGGPGTGGGEGGGVGTGTGNFTGPGKANITQREKRQARWVMIFNTRDGHDYARQLQDLGAILAVPQGEDRFLVIRDLSQRPVQPKVEDIRDINRIFWIDDKPQSVQSLSLALGISPIPAYIAAFFPVELENELREKESRAFRGSEEEIDKTFFRVERRAGGHYEPIVDQVRPRKQ